MRSLVTVLFYFFSITLFLNNGITQAISIYKEGRIIGGDVARAGQFPWQAAIYLNTGTGTFFCGGSLVSTLYVLTAGHCVYGAIEFTVLLGSHHLTANDPNRIRVASSLYIVHPDFNPNTLEHDVGLVQFHMPIAYSDYIQKISVANMGQIFEGIKVTATGWGQISDEDTGLTDELNYVDLAIISNTECQITYGTQIKSGMVCAIGNYNEGICLGDTGSPIIKPGIKGEPLHVGVASFMSQNGCETSEPTGYTRTDVYHPWIYGIIGGS